MAVPYLTNRMLINFLIRFNKKASLGAPKPQVVNFLIEFNNNMEPSNSWKL